MLTSNPNPNPFVHPINFVYILKNLKTTDLHNYNYQSLSILRKGFISRLSRQMIQLIRQQHDVFSTNQTLHLVSHSKISQFARTSRFIHSSINPSMQSANVSRSTDCVSIACNGFWNSFPFPNPWKLARLGCRHVVGSGSSLLPHPQILSLGNILFNRGSDLKRG